MKKGSEQWKEIAAVVLIIGVALAGSCMFLSCVDEHVQRLAESSPLNVAECAAENARW